MSDPTSRALTLLGLLESRPVWTGEELADRLGVTTRTVRRDIDRLRTLGYTVEADTGSGGGYALGRGQMLPPLLLDEDEAVAVALALSSAALGGGSHAEAALRALAKIDDVTPSPVRARVRGVREAVTVSAAGSSVTADVLMPCADAVRRGVRLTFAYRDRRGAHTSRTVEPHRLLARGRSWRLLAFDLDRDDWRTFRLDRLSDPIVGTWRFTSRPDLDDALTRLDEPMPPSAWRHQVTVHIYAPVDEVRASMPSLAGRLRQFDISTTEFTSGADDPGEAAWWLARLARDFTVLGDDEVRAAVDALAGRLRKAASRPAPVDGDTG